MNRCRLLRHRHPQNTTCTHFLPPSATIEEQNPGGQLISVSGKQSDESVVLNVLLNNKQIFMMIIKCKTRGIDPRRGFCRTIVLRSSRRAPPHDRAPDSTRDARSTRKPARRMHTIGRAQPLSRYWALCRQRFAFHAIGIASPDCRIDCLQALGTTLRTLRRPSRCANRRGGQLVCRGQWRPAVR